LQLKPLARMYLAPQFDAWVEIFSQLNCQGFEFGSNPMQQPLTLASGALVSRVGDRDFPRIRSTDFRKSCVIALTAS
jgi:hypothetical protein